MNLLLVLVLPVVFGAQLQILEISPGADISGASDNQLHSSQIPHLAAYFVGAEASKPSGWIGSVDILNRAEATAVIILAGKGHDFKLPVKSLKDVKIVDDAVTPDLSHLKEMISSPYKKGITWIDSSDDGITGTHGAELNSMIAGAAVKTKSLMLRNELTHLEAITAWLHQSKSEVVNGIPDLFEINIEGLHSLTDETRKEGVKETTQAVQEFCTMLSRVYDGNANCLLVVTDAHARSKRDTTAASSTDPDDMYAFYDDNYPVIFHMVLWTSILIAIFVLVVSCGLWFMDPGKDSIIYRMTMTRTKKD